MKKLGNNFGFIVFLTSLFTIFSCREEFYTETLTYENTLEQIVTVEFFTEVKSEPFRKLVIPPHESKSINWRTSDRQGFCEGVGIIRLTFEDGKSIDYLDEYAVGKSSTNLFNIGIYEGNRSERVWKAKITEAHYEEALADENN